MRARIEIGFSQSAADYLRRVAERRRIMAEFDAATAGWDALLMPTTPIIAPPLSAFATDEDFRRINLMLLRNTYVGNLMDRCAVSLPCHAPGTAAVGLMLVGERGGDHALLTVATAVEAALRPVRG